MFTPPTNRLVDWTPGIPGTEAGDLAMVTEWWKLAFVRLNPSLEPPVEPSEGPPEPYKYVAVERTEEDD